jgi:undecaprenyl-diphosphatase
MALNQTCIVEKPPQQRQGQMRKEDALEAVHAIDQGLLYRFETPAPPWIDAVLKAVTCLGYPKVLAVVSALMVLAFLLAGERRAALCLAGAGLLALALLHAGRWYVDRPRPDLAWRRAELPRSSSFPSGHSVASVAVYGTAALLAARRLRRRWQAILLVGGVLALAFLIGFSRIYLGVHYPLDVVGGWMVGLGCALLACWADVSAPARAPPQPPRTNTLSKFE